MQVALYARVSTKDKGQTTENQLRELRAFAERLGYGVYQEYGDQENGDSAERPQLQQLFRDAHQRRFEVVLFWSFDCFRREGVTETLNHYRISGRYRQPGARALFQTHQGRTGAQQQSPWPPSFSRRGGD